MAKGQAREAKVKISVRFYRDIAFRPYLELNRIWYNVVSDDFYSAPVSINYSGAMKNKSYYKEAGRYKAEDKGE